MSEFVKQLLIVCPLLFLAGMCDAIAGGGGTISLPAFLLAGLPTHFALGTNKMCMSMGTAVSVYRYGKSGRIRWFVSLFAAAGAVLGAVLGARIALLIDDGFMRYVLMVLLPASAIFLALNRNFGQEGREKQFPPVKTAIVAFLCGGGVGVYDGFFGPGAGTFYIMALSAALGLGLTEASADSNLRGRGPLEAGHPRDPLHHDRQLRGVQPGHQERAQVRPPRHGGHDRAAVREDDL